MLTSANVGVYNSTAACEYENPRLVADTPVDDEGSPLRGAVIGMLLGAGMWTALAYGAIAIFKH